MSTNATAPTATHASSAGRIHAGSGFWNLATMRLVCSVISAALEPAHVVHDVPPVPGVPDLVAVARHDAAAVAENRVQVAVAARLREVHGQVRHVAHLAGDRA